MVTRSEKILRDAMHDIEANIAKVQVSLENLAAGYKGGTDTVAWLVENNDKRQAEEVKRMTKMGIQYTPNVRAQFEGDIVGKELDLCKPQKQKH